MSRKKIIHALVLIFVLAVPLMGWAEDLLVIVNAKNPTAALSSAEVRKYFLKEQVTWPNGEKVRSVDRLGNTSEKRTFLERIVKLSDDELEQFWVSKRYEKGIPVPPKLHSDNEVIEYVLSFDGAIGYVNAKSVGPAQRSQIKVINTIPMQ